MPPSNPTAAAPNLALRTLLLGRQVAAARALLQINQTELASACGVTRYTLSRFELGLMTMRKSRALAPKAVRQLEKRGIRLLYEGDQLGVMLDPIPAERGRLS